MKKGSGIPRILIILISIMIFLPLVMSAPPVSTIQQFSEGYVIKYPIDETLKQYQDYEFNFHVFNISNGLPITAKITCYFHLYNSTGKHQLIMTEDTPVEVFDYSFNVTGGNFTEIGVYSYILQCDGVTGQGGTILGGFIEVGFSVTTTGKEITQQEATIYFLVTIFAFLIFGILVWLFLNINGSNPKDETGYLGINYRKYIKTALFPLVYVSFIWCFNFIIGLSNNYLGLTLYSNTLGFIFLLLMRLVFPVIIVCGIIAIVLMVKDSNIKKEYKSLWSPY